MIVVWYSGFAKILAENCGVEFIFCDQFVSTGSPCHEGSLAQVCVLVCYRTKFGKT